MEVKGRADKPSAIKPALLTVAGSYFDHNAGLTSTGMLNGLNSHRAWEMVRRALGGVPERVRDE